MRRPKGPLIMTETDVRRLRGVVADLRRRKLEDDRRLADLDRELNMAYVVASEEVPGTVVTMRSTVTVRDTMADTSCTFTLAYPEEADVDRGRISVLAPLGTAVLGYREGDRLSWQMPIGSRDLTIERVDYQPERFGDWDA